MSTFQESVSEVARDIGRSWWVVLLYGIIGVIFGVLAIMQPVEAAAALAWAAGVMALVEAAVSVVALFSKDAPVSKGWLAFYAVISLVFGVLAVMNPLIMAGSLVIVLGLWLSIAGIYRIVFAIRVRKHIRGEWLLIVSGLLAVVLGVLFALNPLGGLMVTSLWIGAMALVYGVLQVVVAFRLRRLGRTAA